MKKNIAIAMLAILGVTLFIACGKEKNTAKSFPISNLESNISLSKEILTQDSIVQNRKNLCWNENDTRMLFKVAMADLGSAWTAFKLLEKSYPLAMVGLSPF